MYDKIPLTQPTLPDSLQAWWRSDVNRFASEGPRPNCEAHDAAWAPMKAFRIRPIGNGISIDGTIETPAEIRSLAKMLVSVADRLEKGENELPPYCLGLPQPRKRRNPK